MTINPKLQLIVGVIALFLILVLLYSHCVQKKSIITREPYEDLFYAKDYAAGNFVSRPNFKADLSPRFDTERTGGGQILGTYPGMSVQGAPLTPVQGVMDKRESTPSYAAMGGSNGAYADLRLPSGGLTTSQVNQVMMEKFGRSGDNLTNPKALLPVPDMKKALAKDPSDPGTFMYDRYLFAPLKRRFGGVDVDHIRGDLPIEQLRMGWFDVAPVAKQDLAQGYFSTYLDISQATNLQDVLYDRGPTVGEANQPWGRAAQEWVYSAL